MLVLADSQLQKQKEEQLEWIRISELNAKEELFKFCFFLQWTFDLSSSPRF